MKKLGKLKLNNFSEMSEQEMKFVIGGQYDPNAKKACHETAPTCGGVCAPAFIYASDGTLTTVTKTCHGAAKTTGPGTGARLLRNG